ncbi:MAG: dihydrodipicolinate synthase family protein [Dysgonamonadaceae bacterium]|jgi:4-hydroxy-tetrahydrodipicolinate synthase|nr:dihydrodipicolinate synthase family protein [Dysgonamonadaceae bacterium]
MDKKYGGVVVPMITPLLEDCQIDTVAVANIMATFADNNISPLLLGTTGESSSLGRLESVSLLNAAVKAGHSKQVIYVGLVGNNVSSLIERINMYADFGADVIVATLPSYYILTPSQMEKFYTRMADVSPLPLMMYNIKATTQMSIPLDIVEKLSHHPNILGLKDSERDPERLEICINTYRNRADFSFFCGWGAQSLPSLRMGADGVVPSTGNIVPEMYKELYDAFLRKDYLQAEKMQEKTDAVAAIYQKGRTLGQSLAALKAMMETRGLCQSYMMPPLTELSHPEIEELKNRHY